VPPPQLWITKPNPIVILPKGQASIHQILQLLAVVKVAVFGYVVILKRLSEIEYLDSLLSLKVAVRKCMILPCFTGQIYASFCLNP
jgi:hypothetical protein